MSVKRVIVPNLLGWLLLVQAPIAAIAIYASVFVFAGKSVPFILAVVATTLHLLLGIYCYLTRSKPGSYHVFVILPWLAVCAGLWCGPLSYFARHVSLIADYPEGGWLKEGGDRHQVLTWTRAGCAVSALSIFVDIMLAGFFILAIRRQEVEESETGSFTSSPLETPPQLPPFVSLQNHRISFPNRPPTATAPNRNPHLPPTIIVVPESQTQRHPRQTQPPPLQPSPQPPQQPRHQTQQHHHNTLHRKPSKPLPPLPPKTKTTTTTTTTTTSITLPPFSPTATPPNRILLILHLTTHQHLPAGNFPPTAEVTTLLQAWTGNRAAISLGGGRGDRGGREGREAEAEGGGGRRAGHGATALAHACLTDLCGRVWAAQREGREEEVLSGEELAVLEGVAGWDLGWVGGRIERAAGWLGREGGGGL